MEVPWAKVGVLGPSQIAWGKVSVLDKRKCVWPKGIVFSTQGHSPLSPRTLSSQPKDIFNIAVVSLFSSMFLHCVGDPCSSFCWRSMLLSPNKVACAVAILFFDHHMHFDQTGTASIHTGSRTALLPGSHGMCLRPGDGRRDTGQQAEVCACESWIPGSACMLLSR